MCHHHGLIFKVETLLISFFRYYYAEDDSDPGIVMETTVSSKDVNEKMCTEIGTYYHKSTLLQIREGLSEFVDQDGGLKVRIQWELNYLLFQATFSQNDEVARFHNIQMRYRIIKEAFFSKACRIVYSTLQLILFV